MCLILYLLFIQLVAYQKCLTIAVITGPNPEGCSGDDIREAWISYAPYSHDGRVGALGFVGCPGGGDWCYASSGPAAGGQASAGVSSNARNVAATLAGLGSGGSVARPASGGKKQYGIGSWKK